MKNLWEQLCHYVSSARNRITLRNTVQPLRLQSYQAAHGSFKPGDYVLLRQGSKAPRLTEALHPHGEIPTSRGILKHATILGKRPRDVVQSQHGQQFRLAVPTMADFVTLTPRLVTPVYPPDANFIVSLLDLHSDKSNPGADDPVVEILEAGTGHGGLTLYLARAIHAANVHVSRASATLNSSTVPKNGGVGRRGAIVHTVDVNSGHSRRAQQTLNGFRQGLYANDVVFYVASVSKWVDNQVETRNLEQAQDNPFLDHVILDMPDAEQNVAKVASVLRVDGNLIVFNPSISQIMLVLQHIHRSRLPLVLDQVIELGHGLTGGRLWDLRVAEPKASRSLHDSPQEPFEQEKSIDTSKRTSASPETSFLYQDLQMVCRPLVGDRIRGGGFVAVWKKLKTFDM